MARIKSEVLGRYGKTGVKINWFLKATILVIAALIRLRDNVLDNVYPGRSVS